MRRDNRARHPESIAMFKQLKLAVGWKSSFQTGIQLKAWAKSCGETGPKETDYV